MENYLWQDNIMPIVVNLVQIRPKMTFGCVFCLFWRPFNKDQPSLYLTNWLSFFTTLITIKRGTIVVISLICFLFKTIDFYTYWLLPLVTGFATNQPPIYGVGLKVFKEKWGCEICVMFMSRTKIHQLEDDITVEVESSAPIERS